MKKMVILFRTLRSRGSTKSHAVCSWRWHDGAL